MCVLLLKHVFSTSFDNRLNLYLYIDPLHEKKGVISSCIRILSRTWGANASKCYNDV